MGDYQLTGLKNNGQMAVDFDHGCGLLSPEDQEMLQHGLRRFNDDHAARSGQESIAQGLPWVS
jgi:hypothetical protein